MAGTSPAMTIKLASYDNEDQPAALVSSHSQNGLRLQRGIPGAAGRILDLASGTFGNPVVREPGITEKFADTFLHRPFQLVANARNAVGIDAEHLMRTFTGDHLHLAVCPLGDAIRCELRIANDLAEAFLQGSFDLMTDPVEAILVHDALLAA
jgi:hypothetical protein